MLKKRLIACLLVREGLIVQSVGFNRYLPVGRPRFPIEFVVRWDVDEIVLLDMSATTENRPPDHKIIQLLSKSCFVPLTVGGGIKSVSDVHNIIRAGADKVSLNAHALERPNLIKEVAQTFGCQCAVVSIDSKRERDGKYYVYSHSGKKRWSIETREWAQKVESLGAGEIFLNSIDRDGSKTGYDIELIQSITSCVSIPVIACGGVGNYTHFAPGIIEGGAPAVAAANIFHHVEHSTILAKAHMVKKNIDVRLDSQARYVGREFDEDGRLLMLDSASLNEIEFKRGKTDDLL